MSFYSKIKKEKNKDRSIIITSCNTNEEKNKTAVDIGISFASAGKKVILIVTDMLENRIYENCNVELLKKYIEKTSVSNFDILTNKGLQSSSSELPNNKNIKKLINQLKKIYDIIIVDGLPYSNKKTYKNKQDKPKQNSKEKHRIYLKSIINKQSKHIEKLGKIVTGLNKKLDNNQVIEIAINNQSEKFRHELDNNTNEINKIIEEKNNQSILAYKENTEKIMQELNNIKEEINKVESKINENIQEKIKQEITKMQENMKDEIRQEVISTQERINDTKIKIKKESQEKINRMQKDIKTETKEELNKIQEKMQKEIDKIQEKLHEETQKQISRINKETNQNINKIHEEMIEKINKAKEEKQEEKTQKAKSNIKLSTQNKKITIHPIDKDIMYEDLEKTATYVISLEKENKHENEKDKKLQEPKEYKFNMRYIYGKYFKRDKIYNE